MKNFKKAAALLIICFGIIGYAFAHAPEDMVVAYDAKNKVISIGVVHITDDPARHFIKEVKIKLNSKEIITQNFFSQTDKRVQAVSYVVVDAKNKDNIEVTAVSNKGESLKRTFKVE